MKSDEAGPMIGWSLGTGMKQRAFDELLTFPCTHAFKAVGVADDNLAESLRKAISAEIGREVDPDQVSIRDSRAGKYRSVTLAVDVQTSDEVYAIYRLLSEIDAVRYVL